MKDALMVAAEAASHLHDQGIKLSPAGLRRASDHGEIPVRRTKSGIRLFRQVDLDRFARRRLAANRG